MIRILTILTCLPVFGWADTIVASRPIRPQQIVTSADIRVDPANIAGAYSTLNAVVGLEAQVAIYPGRAIMQGQLAVPALVERNQMVELIYAHGGLRIVAEGRALGRGSAGQRIRVMNTVSRTVLFGTIAENGSVTVSK